MSEKSYILATVQKDWADEFTSSAFAAMPLSEWQELQDQIKEHYLQHGLFSIYFGTNEGWDDLSFSQWIADITVMPITESEYNILHKLFQPEYKQEDSKVIWGTASSYFQPGFL